MAGDDPEAGATTAGARRSTTRILVTLACVCVIVAGLRAAAMFFVPAAIALLLALTCVPIVRRLQNAGMPAAAAILLVMVVVVAALLAVPLVLTASLHDLREALPAYRERVDPLLDGAIVALREHGIELPPGLSAADWLGTGAAFEFAIDTAGGLLELLSKLVVVLLITVFALFEAQVLPGKLRAAFGSEASARAFEQIVERIGGYISVKTATSLLTGASVAVLDAAVGVDFPVLWGFVAFAFNFVPNIGSIVAAIPPILIAALALGPGSAVVVTVGYLAINLSISNGLEPHLMGTRLGLSTLVVFLSLVFWFWVWGPVGMLVSVPLTAILKIGLENSDEYRHIAVLLGRRGGAEDGAR